VIDETISQPVASREKEAAVINAVDGLDQGRHRRKEPYQARHKIGVHHVAVDQVRFPAPHQANEPNQAAGMRDPPGHLQRLGWNPQAAGLVPHGSQLGERHDQQLVSFSAELLGGSENLFVGASHPHAGGQQ